MEPSGSVKSATRTLDVLELLVAQSQPMPANAIAAALGIPMSSLSYLLATLVERGYVQRDGRLYAAGPAMERLRLRTVAPTLAERAAPLVRMLRNDLNETAGFFVRRRFEIEAVASEIASQALRYTLEVGQRAPLHSFSAGKALLAAMSDAELDDYFRTVERRAMTIHTLTSEPQLRVEIAAIRDTGFARSREEHTPGTCGIGRAVVAAGAAVGAFSIGVPVARYDSTVETRAMRLLTRATETLAADAG